MKIAPGSSSGISIAKHGGTAPHPVHHAIITLLSIAFTLVSIQAIRTLAPAFADAYDGINRYQPFRPQDESDHPLIQESTLHAKYFSPEVERWAPDIRRWAAATSLPPDLIAIVMQVESCGDPLARSSAGAMGIFQVMPFHFGSHDNPYDPETNAQRGLAYLAKGYERSQGRIDLTLAGYNGGHSVIDLDPHLWPEETQSYVVWGAGLWEDIQSQRHPSPTLDNWLKSGGIRLCMAASVEVTDIFTHN